MANKPNSPAELTRGIGVSARQGLGGRAKHDRVRQPDGIDTPLSNRDRINVLLEEYRALNALLAFRMTAMDRRLPVAGGLFALLLGSMSSLSGETRLWLLLTLPLGLMWLVITTANHAKSKEDHLRRIDEIERLVNAIAGEELMAFQSRHPKKTPRGTLDRTALGTGLAVVTSSLVMLIACQSVFAALPSVGYELRCAYLSYVVFSACVMSIHGRSFIRYRYRKQPSDPPPLQLIRRIRDVLG